MSQELLDEPYLAWLHALVVSPRLQGPPAKTYTNLLLTLYKTEFVWLIPNDDNRMVDGLELRHEFVSARKIPLDRFDDPWMSIGCSVLEMLIALSRRLAFEAEGEPRGWFWKLLENLGLDKQHDGQSFDYEHVVETLDNMIWRTYAPNGQGGLFPLENPDQDQAEVEIWYQLNAYLLETE